MNLKKIIKIFTLILIIVLIIVFISSIVLSGKKMAEQKKINAIADSLYQEANTLLRKQDIVSSKDRLILIMELKTTDGKENIFLDSAKKLNKCLDEYLINWQWQGDKKYKEVLLKLPDFEVRMLLKNELFKSYVFHPFLDSLIIQTLYKNRHIIKSKRPYLMDYIIIKEKKFKTAKATIYIRLNQELDKNKIINIANEIRNNGRQNFRRIFIFYLLPGMKFGEGAWATSHFNPKLKVDILGWEKGEKEKIAKSIQSLNGKVIGNWIGNAIVGGIYTIIQKEGNFILNVKYKDGSESSKNLIEKRIKGKRCFFKHNNRYGEYFVLNNNGMLGIYDNEGLITTLNAYK